MSLLGTQVYANPATPIWLNANGGTISGNLEVKGSVHATNQLQADQSLVLFDPSGSVVRGQLSTDGGGTMYVRAPSYITFSQTGNPPPLAGNTTLTLSAPGSGLDNLTVGGFINGIGVVPTNSVSPASPTTIALTTGNASRVASFGLTTPYVPIAGKEYDVQASGFISWTAGTAPAAGDIVTVTLTSGSGPVAEISQVYYPGVAPFTFTLNTGNAFNIRGRIIAPATPSAFISVRVNFSGSASTGTISGTLNLLDIVRVA